MDIQISTLAVLGMIAEERERQLDKWGLQHHSNTRWITILAEEFGEAAKEVCDSLENQQDRKEQLVDELVQVAAVATAFIEDLMNQNESTD